ncbi:EAL domain-containing protein [Sporosarcina sp. 179-K 8C2 HS]|uniref:sensor domain-containing protein n=1 Tax=Sporosarcina sp. 179-K 8C2 HS TaxID=3142387 RepID=UPI0039A392A6
MDKYYLSKSHLDILDPITDHFFEAVVLFDRNGFLKLSSDSIETVLGYTPEEMNGKKYYDFIDREEWQIAKMIASTCVKKKRGFLVTELKLKKANGSSIFCEIQIENGLSNSAIAGMIINVRRASNKVEPLFALSDARRHTIIYNDLPKAIERDELRLHYQPKVNLNTGKVVGVEALVRWEHPELGLVFPNELIPVAEELGEITVIGNWVIREACMQNKTWQNEGHPTLVMSVNLSMQQFQEDNLVSVIAEILQDTLLHPRYLELEITESMTADVQHTISVLQRIKSLGLLISIDDFGTGYSNLNHLKNFPLDILKIDKSFISESTHNPVDQAIVKTIIHLARDLDLNVLAEGIESVEHLQFLKEQSCTLGQGYLFSKPVDASELMRTINHIESNIDLRMNRAAYAEY